MGLQAIAIQMGVSWGLGWLNKQMTGGPKKPPPPRPDDLEFPLATIGAPVPIVYGTVRIDNPVLVWGGLFDYTLNPATNTNRYGASMLFVLGVPPDRNLVGPSWGAPVLRKMWFGDAVASLGALPGGVLTHGNNIDVYNYLGGEGRGGELNGFIEFFDGRADQVITTYPAAPTNRIDTCFHNDFTLNGKSNRSLVPGYRHQMLMAVICDQATFSDLTFGETAQVPPIAAEVSAVDANAINTVDANPAWVLYDLICGAVFKLGYPIAKVDLATFTAAAAILVTEQNGCSVVIATDEDVTNAIERLCAQIDGAIYEDPSDGLIKLRLIRAVSPVGLPELTVDNTIGRPQLTVTGWMETANHVEAAFTNRSKEYKPDSAPAKRIANAVGQDYRPRLRTVQYPYVMTAALAAKLAARDLAVMGRPLMTCTAYVTRDFDTLTIGEAVIANWPQYGVTSKVFRVLDVDRGQLADGKIRLSLIEDAFDQQAGYVEPPVVDVAAANLLPVLHRLVTEAPYWLTRRAYMRGWIADATSPRLLASGRKELTGQGAFSWGAASRVGADPYAADVPAQTWPTTAVLVSAYPAIYEPYDTSHGIVIEDLTGDLATAIANDPTSQNATASNVAAGANLVQLGDELLAFESITSLGGGQYRLNNVWRALHDTAPQDHAAGDVVFWLGWDQVGKRAHLRGSDIDVWLGPGGDNTERLTDEVEIAGSETGILGTASRTQQPLRAADLCLGAREAVTGTQGLPAVAGGYKAISSFEGALDASWRQRDANAITAVRGDDATSYVVQPNATWSFYAQKQGAGEVAIVTALANASVSAEGLLVGGAGHGTIDVKLRTVSQLLSSSWQDATIRVEAHRARNLLANSFGEYGALNPGWTATSGTFTVATGTSSLAQTVDGAYFTAATGVVVADKRLSIMQQTVDVAGYLATGLTAIATWYTRNFSGDADDYATVQLEALDASGTLIGSATTSANVIGPTTRWLRTDLTKVLPAGTAQVRVTVVLAGTGSALALAAVAGITLTIGQASSQLLANPSFDGASLASWTTVAGTWSAGGDDYASSGGTAGAARMAIVDGTPGEILQKVAVPTGYSYGDAVLTFAAIGNSTTGEVILEALDASDSVLADASANVPAGTSYDRHKVTLTLPNDTVSLQVRVTSQDINGAGDNPHFDDFSLRIHKDLDPAYELDLDFGTPARQLAPTTWQDLYLALPELPLGIVWDGASEMPSVPPSLAEPYSAAVWSDALVHAAAKAPGHFTVDGADAASVDAYRFTRAIAAAAVDIQVDNYGAFAFAEPFTVGVLFRVTEASLSVACGLVGRRSASGVGWGLALTAAGAITGTVQGTTATAATAGLGDARDGALHWAWLVYDGAGGIRVITELAAAQTAAGAAGTISDATAVLRIGRDGPASATGGVDIARVLLFADDLSDAQIRTVMQLGQDPNGRMTSDTATQWTSSQAVWVEGAPDADGATLVRCAAAHVPIAYRSELAADGDAFGVATVRANTNRWTDLINAEAGATATTGIVDPTGMPRGIRVANVAPSAGITVEDLNVDVAAEVTTVLYLRSDDGPMSVTVELVSVGGVVVVDSVSVDVTTTWERHEMVFAWGDYDSEAWLRLRAVDVGVEFDLASVVWIGTTAAPPALQDPTLAIGDTYGFVTEALPLQLHHEGELYAEAVGDPVLGATVLSVDNNVDEDNQRALVLDGATTIPELTLWDAVGAATTVSGVGTDWSTATKTVRGRWNKLELPEALGKQVSIVGGGDAAVAFAVPAAASLTRIRIGGGNPLASTSPNLIVRRAVVRGREEKLA